MQKHALLLLAALFCACCSPEPATSPAPQDADPALPPAKPPQLASIEATGDPAIDALAAFVAGQRIDKAAPGWQTRLPKPPQVSFAEGKKYVWKLRTNKGPIEIELMPDAAPMHVSSTMYLTLLGFYDGLKFHRVMKGFMAQGGDPLGSGQGGPGYQYASEILVRCKNTECKHEFFGENAEVVSQRKYFACPQCSKLSAPAILHDGPGLLSMANTGEPGSDGSQFFLTFQPAPWLNGGHTVFGRVVRGHNTLEVLESLGNEGDGPPQETLFIETATIAVQ
jgi:cyclophilin family peptidyl-prolyl cis-trans isomerase